MLHGLGNACYAINKHVNNACDEAYCQQNRTDDIIPVHEQQKRIDTTKFTIDQTL